MSADDASSSREPSGQGEFPAKQTASPVSDSSDLPGALAFAQIGGTLVAFETAGVLLGLWVDRAAGVSPWGLLIGIVLGTAGAGASVFAQVRRYL